jgi:hypothetical protein
MTYSEMPKLAVAIAAVALALLASQAHAATFTPIHAPAKPDVTVLMVEGELQYPDDSTAFKKVADSIAPNTGELTAMIALATSISTGSDPTTNCDVATGPSTAPAASGRTARTLQVSPSVRSNVVFGLGPSSKPCIERLT